MAAWTAKQGGYVFLKQGFERRAGKVCQSGNGDALDLPEWITEDFTIGFFDGELILPDTDLAAGMIDVQVIVRH